MKQYIVYPTMLLSYALISIILNANSYSFDFKVD